MPRGRNWWYIIAIVVLMTATLFALRLWNGSGTDKLEVTGQARSGAEGDRLVIEQLRQAGADVSKRTNLIFYLYIPSRADAESAGSDLESAGYSVQVEDPLGKLTDGTSSLDYCVVASRTQVPSLENVSRARAEFERLARLYHGDYDGWEAAITR